MEETLNQLTQNLPEWLNWKSFGGFLLLVLGFFFAIRMLGGIIRLLVTLAILILGAWLFWHFGMQFSTPQP